MTVSDPRHNRTLFGSPRAALAFWAGAAGLMLVALALWQRHGLLIYVDMLATAIRSCF